MGKYGHLQKTQANQLFQILQMEGLVPDRFAIVLETAFESRWGTDSVILLLKEDQHYYFNFALDNRVSHGGYSGPKRGEHAIEWSPGRETPSDQQIGVPWDDVLFEFRGWAMRLKRELDADDLWAGLARARTSIAIPETDNSKFAEEERRIVAQSLDSLLARVNESHLLTSGQLTDLRNVLGELKDATEHIGKKDWKLLYLGALLGFMMEHGLAGEVSRSLFEIAGHTLTNIIAQIGVHLPQLLR